MPTGPFPASLAARSWHVTQALPVRCTWPGLEIRSYSPGQKGPAESSPAWWWRCGSGRGNDCEVFIRLVLWHDSEKAMAPSPMLLPGKPHGRRSLVASVHGVAKSRTWLSDFTFTFHFHALEKEMATHSRVLAWRIPGTAEPGGLQSMGSHRVRHDWRDLAAAVTRFTVNLLALWLRMCFSIPPSSSVSS